MAADRVTSFKIYVGNVPHDAKNEEIQKIFEEFGTVVECDTVGKRAFVHMEDDIEGKHAVGELQGRELNGVKLIIQEARKNELPRIPTVKLLVKNISSSVDARGLRNMFKRFGCVIEVEIENGEGFVRLEAIADIRSAINEMNGHKIDDMELSVEPAPTPAPTETETSDFAPSSFTSSPKKDRNSFSNKKGYDKYGSSWTPVEQESDGDYYESGSYGYDSYENPSPWMIPPRSPFQSEPERILRDPFARGRGRGSRGPMGQRRPPPRMMPPQPLSPFHDPSMGGRVMRSGMPMPQRGHPPSFFNHRGGPPPPVQHNPWQDSYDYDESAFYEDEPISMVPRSSMMSHTKRKFTGANSMPIGRGGGASMGPVFRDPGFQGRGNGNANRRGGGRGRGGGRPNNFTALTEDVTPGERYPVPPAFNPGFRAPMKRPKEELVKKKIKKKKKPLVPAELPDYTVPVPELPKESVPRGAVLTPFPPPQGHSVIDSDTFGGNGSGSFFEQQGGYQNDQSSSQMDFTTDEC